MINNWESCISCLLSSKYLWIQEFYERISSSDYSSCVEEVIENPTLYPPIILEFGTFGHILVTACKNMRFKRGSYRTGRDTSSFLVWITLGLSWVLPLVLGLDAWVFSLHLQTYSPPSLLPGHYAIIKGREEGRGKRRDSPKVIMA